MAFLVYRRRLENGKDVLEATGDHFRLAGYNLIYGVWKRKGKPIREGWRARVLPQLTVVMFPAPALVVEPA
jgi:hypothetical protein